MALAAQGMMQIFLVTLCFAIGRGLGGLGGLGGALPPFPLLLPISVSFLSIPLSRLIWDPWQAVGLETISNQSAQLEGTSPTDQTQAATANALARRLIEPLADLPADIDLATLQSHLAALSGHADEARIRAALMDRAQAGLAVAAELKALVLHTTDPRLIKGISENGPAEVLAILPQDAELIALFADRLLAALQLNALLRPQLPKPGQLSLLADALRETPAEAPLRRLIQTIRDAARV